jgi:hypothetical protein
MDAFEPRVRNCLVLGAALVLAGCWRDNPGFKAIDSQGESEPGLTTTGTTAPDVTTTTTTEPPDPTTSTGPDTSTGVGPTGDETSTGDAEMTGTSTGEIDNICDEPAEIAVKVKADTFLMRHKGPAACDYVDDNEVPGFNPQGAYCRNRSFGEVARLPLAYDTMSDPASMIVYALQFDLTTLVDPQDPNTPIPWDAIQRVHVEFIAERTGNVVPNLQVRVLPKPEAWLGESGHGVLCPTGETSFRCRACPNSEGPEDAECPAEWADGDAEGLLAKVQPLPVDLDIDAVLAMNEIEAVHFDIERDLLPPDFFDPASHRGVFISMNPGLGNDAKKVRVFAKESEQSDPVLRVFYCTE